MKDKLKKIGFLRKAVLRLYGIKNNLVGLVTEKSFYDNYHRQIENIIRNKEIVLSLTWGGLGDVLVFTSLPRLLFERYGVKFYLAEETRLVFRHPDILKLCFELNPYFKGFKKSSDVFNYRGFSRDKSWLNILTDISGTNHTSRLEKQFGLISKGLPEIYYQAKNIADYNKVVLVDTNFISGRKFFWLYNQPKIDQLIKKYKNLGSRIETVNPQEQDLFRYADMIKSSAKFITVLSGGAALAAALGKKADVFLPYNAGGESVYGFIFKNSPINYV